MTLIYKLIDPRDGEVRYVGKTTKSLAKRRAEHLCAAKLAKTHRDKWLLTLTVEGLKPIIELIEYVEDSDWEDREIYWIAEYRKSHSLTNHSDGGGVNRPQSGELNHKAVFSKVDVREAVTLFSIGFSRDVIRSFTKFKNLSDKTLRSWCQKETRALDTEGIPTRREFMRTTQ